MKKLTAALTALSVATIALAAQATETIESAGWSWL